MSAAEYYRERRAFIDELGNSLKCFKDFEAIQYAWSIKTGEEYVRIQDAISNDVYLHVEDMTDADIYKEICRVILAGEIDECVPNRLVTDPDEKRTIVALLREDRDAKN